MWHGRHELKAGIAYNERSYGGFTTSDPIQFLREDSSCWPSRSIFRAAESPMGSDNEVAEFFQDHWTVRNNLAFDLGMRLVSQTAGSPAAPAPRIGLSYFPAASQKTVIHAGAGPAPRPRSTAHHGLHRQPYAGDQYL